MKDGFYPIVIGGDKTQCHGSISAMKEHEPNTKLLWVDSSSSSDQSKDESYRTLEYLRGRKVPEGHSQIQQLGDKDLTIFGATDVDLKTKDELIFGA